MNDLTHQIIQNSNREAATKMAIEFSKASNKFKKDNLNNSTYLVAISMYLASFFRVYGADESIVNQGLQTIEDIVKSGFQAIKDENIPEN